jgi:monoamine oxidase
VHAQKRPRRTSGAASAVALERVWSNKMLQKRQNEIPERRKRVIADLTYYFGPAAGRPTAVLEQDWTAEEYTRGCYGAFTSPGALTRFGRATSV